MSKSATILLVAIALAVGLWLGFNPRAHAQTVQSWDHARAAFVQATASLRLAPKTAVMPRATTTTKPIIAQPSASAAWKQISTAFESLVSSLQRLWLSISAKVKI